LKVKRSGKGSKVIVVGAGEGVGCLETLIVRAGEKSRFARRGNTQLVEATLGKAGQGTH